MRFSRFHALKILAPYIECVWILEEDGNVTTQEFDRVLPDGAAELIFNVADGFHCRIGNEITKQPEAVLFGQISRFIELRPAGSVFTIGVKFKPNGLAHFTRIPQQALSNAYHAVGDIFPTFEANIIDRLQALPTKESKVAFVQTFLVEILKKQDASPLRKISSVDYALSELRKTYGMKKIRDIASDLSLTTRELERKFQIDVGLTPKQLAKVYRFQNVLTLKNHFSSLTALSLEAGYYDQSHFIKDFKDITGTNPGTLLNHQSNLTATFLPG